MSWFAVIPSASADMCTHRLIALLIAAASLAFHHTDSVHHVAQAARNNEMGFFRTNPAYAGCTNIGTDFLSTKLSSQLVRAIQQQLPVITTSIDNGCAFG